MWDEGEQGGMEGPVQACYPAVPQFAMQCKAESCADVLWPGSGV